MLANLLFGTYRRRVLGLMLLHPEATYHVREIARQTNTKAGTLHKELSRLAEVGLLTRKKMGNQLHYAANRQCPIFQELASILRKTSGLADVVLDALASLEGKISVALIFGSLARGEERSGSDVDVLIIGSLGFAEAVKALHPQQEKIGREINPVVMSPEEYRRKKNEGEGFVREILANEKIFLKGDDNELGKFGCHPAAEQA